MIILKIKAVQFWDDIKFLPTIISAKIGDFKQIDCVAPKNFIREYHGAHVKGKEINNT